MSESTIPAPFTEADAQANVDQMKINSYDRLTTELSEAKAFIREVTVDGKNLAAPSDLQSIAAMQATQIEHKGREIFKKRKEASKDFEEWQMIELELLNLKAREEAKRLYKLEASDADLSLFQNSMSLADALALPEEPVQWRIKDLLMVGHITTVTAPAKAGKTVLQVNRVKSYVDGVPLFDRFQTTTPVTGNVGVWNYELNQAQMHDWFRSAGIVNRHKIIVINARGAGLFIQNEIVLEAAIKWANDNEIEILEIDPLQAAFIGSVSSDEDAASYINALQRLQKETGIKDIILTTHMGHGGKTDSNLERSIGSARWEGFPDNMWIYKRDHNSGVSYLRIDKGRMEPVPEFGLACDTSTWKLTHMGDNSGVEAKKQNEEYRNVVSKLYSGESILKSKLKEVNGKATAKKTAVGKMIDDLIEAGIVSEDSEKQESGQKAYVITMNATGCTLFRNMISDKGEIRPFTPEELADAFEEVQGR